MAYDFQSALEKETYHLLMKKGWCVLAGSCGAGKTNMTLKIIERKYLRDFPNEKVLILAHGQMQLRNQWADRIESMQRDRRLKRSFQYGIFIGRSLELKYQVTIALPFSFIELENVPQVGLLVVDEAHHFYHSEIIQNFIRKCKPKYVLLLTGTPSRFIRERQHPLVAMSSGELLKYKVISDPIIEIVESTYEYGIDSYNVRDELTLTAQRAATTKQTNKTLEKILDALLSKLSTQDRINHVARSALKLRINDRLDKTLIACHNQKQAQDVFNFFIARNVECALSTSSTDIESEKIREFTENKQCKILIVVFRAVIGFDCPELANVVDMTGSKNPDRIFQLLSRVVRRNRSSPRKLFLKITSPEVYRLHYLIMCCVVAMSDRQFYLSYDGNYSKAKILLPKHIIETSRKLLKRKRKKSNQQKSLPSLSKWRLPNMNLFIQLQKNSGDILQENCFTTFEEAQSLLYSSRKMPDHFWTKEKCIEEARKHISKIEWRKNGKGSYYIAYKNNWVTECIGHMKGLYKGRNYWTKERCLDSARKYKTRSEWRTNEESAMVKSRQAGWFDECAAHMVRTKKSSGYWTKERCVEDARKYQTRSEWAKSGTAAYSVSKRNDFFLECVQHMLKPFSRKIKKL